MLKLALYVCPLNIFHLLKTEGVNQKEDKSKITIKNARNLLKS